MIIFGVLKCFTSCVIAHLIFASSCVPVSKVDRLNSYIITKEGTEKDATVAASEVQALLLKMLFQNSF